MNPLTIYIGYDSREPVAYEVCKWSILKHASKPVNIQPLKLDKLKAQALITREFTKENGKLWDEVSASYASTEFAISRFLAPLLQQTGYAIFMDCDMLVVDDIYKVLAEADRRYAVQCVKHEHTPVETEKMDGQVQEAYPRKNWSSFFLINADHEGHERLTMGAINHRPGRILHRFYWLDDWEIGSLSSGWNWLVDVQEKPEKLYVAHYTLGGPWFPSWEPRDSDRLWLDAVALYNEERSAAV